MSCRILNCSISLQNYYLCINEKVVGFSSKIANPEDTIYISVKVDKSIICGAKAILSEITDYKPWEDSDRYKQCFSLKNIEFCTPFNLNILSTIEQKNWYLIFVQASKAIKNLKALKLLENTFNKNKINELFIIPTTEEIDNSENITSKTDICLNHLPLKKHQDNDNIKIMGTFQTINFLNETDKQRGLEILVNKNFYSLFPFYPNERTLLISDNRLFSTKGFEKSVTGIRAIPDGLLIVFNKDFKYPIQINLIEYECFGEQKTKSLEKFNYLNCHIIPQLMRFASTFSIVTDTQIRDQTIKSWTNKIIDYIFSNHNTQQRIIAWIKELNPNVQEQKVALELQNAILNAFKWNMRIILIIDELSVDQRDTLKNVINSFKLENGKGIDFISYIVRLEQKINVIDASLEYALSFQ